MGSFAATCANLTLNAGILRSQTQAIQSETEANITALSNALNAPRELSVQLDLGVDPILKPRNTGAAIRLASGFLATMDFTGVVSLAGGFPALASHFSIEGKLLFSELVPSTSPRAEWRQDTLSMAGLNLTSTRL